MKYLKSLRIWLLLVMWNLLLFSLYLQYTNEVDNKNNWTPKNLMLNDGTIISNGKQFGRDDNCPMFTRVTCSCGSSYWVRLNESLEESPSIVPIMELPRIKMNFNNTIPNGLTLQVMSYEREKEVYHSCKQCGSQLQWYHYKSINLK